MCVCVCVVVVAWRPMTEGCWCTLSRILIAVCRAIFLFLLFLLLAALFFLRLVLVRLYNLLVLFLRIAS